MDVDMRDDIFDPVVVEVSVGDTVRWTNRGPVGSHTVTTQPGTPESFDSGPRFIGQSFDFTFPEPGTYWYYCRFHGSPDVRPDPERAEDDQPCGMCGIVQVTGEGSPATPAPTPAPAPAPAPTPAPTPTPRSTPTPTPMEEPEPTPATTPELALPTPSPMPTPDLQAAGDDGGGGPRTAAVVVLVIAMGGAGLVAWRSLLSDR